MQQHLKLLKYHMDCNPDYIFQHAEIAGMLATKQFKTYNEYRIACQNMGISYYSEELFNDFIAGKK